MEDMISAVPSRRSLLGQLVKLVEYKLNNGHKLVWANEKPILSQSSKTVQQERHAVPNIVRQMSRRRP